MRYRAVGVDSAATLPVSAERDAVAQSELTERPTVAKERSLAVLLAAV